MYVITMRKRGHELEGRVVRGFERRNGREKFCNYIIISKRKKILQASVRPNEMRYDGCSNEDTTI